MVPQVRRLRRLSAPYIGPLARRLLGAAQRLRRLRNAARLFRRSIQSRSLGLGWIPRTWLERRGRVLRWLRGQLLRVHRGRRWRRLPIQRFNVGFAIGNFARTTKPAQFKKRASAKKRRRRQLQTFAPGQEWRIQRIKDTRAGLRRRTLLVYDPLLEAQLRGLT